MSIYINHSTNDVSTNAGGKVTSAGNSVITTADAATDTTPGIVELATTAEVQTGTDTTRSPSVASLRGGLLVQGSAITTTSGTSHDFTSIPSWVKKITIMLDGVSTSGTNFPIIQIGTGGTPTTTGYTGYAVNMNNTPATSFSANSSGWIISSANAANILYGQFTLVNVTSNSWAIFGGSNNNSTASCFVNGTLALAGVLDMVRLTTIGGTDTFDAGTFNIIYE